MSLASPGGDAHLAAFLGARRRAPPSRGTFYGDQICQSAAGGLMRASKIAAFGQNSGVCAASRRSREGGTFVLAHRPAGVDADTLDHRLHPS